VFSHVLSTIAQTCDTLTAAGLKVELITGAGTGTFGMEANSGVYGELQPGSYLFMDVDYSLNQTDPSLPQFEHALFVKTQIMSVSAEHVVCDAGHKAHAIDSGMPKVVNSTFPLEFFNGGDEHGVLRCPEGTEAGDVKLPNLGDELWLLPGHCDPTVNLHDVIIGVRGGLDKGIVSELIDVDTRGVLN